MEYIFDIFNLYFTFAIPLFVINTLLALRTSASLPEAIESEAVRCGLPPAGAAVNTIWQNGVYALVAWPVGIVQMLRNLFG